MPKYFDYACTFFSKLREQQSNYSVSFKIVGEPRERPRFNEYSNTHINTKLRVVHHQNQIQYHKPKSQKQMNQTGYQINNTFIKEENKKISNHRSIIK